MARLLAFLIPILFLAVDASAQITNYGAQQLPGSKANDSAVAGNLGEFVTSSVPSSTTNLSTATPADATTISLTAGDWDVWFIAAFTGNAATTVTNLIASINTSTALSANLDQTSRVGLGSNPTIYGQSANNTIAAGPARLSLSTTTTIHGVCQSSFGTNTSSCGGVLSARRRR